VDLAAVAGAPVLAAGPGTVVFAGPVAGRMVVSIDHAGGLRSTYEPVSPLVRAGEVVAGGQQIGTLQPGHGTPGAADSGARPGDGGCGATVCLHWGVRRGMDYLDPLRLLGLGGVRLLPWEDPAPGSRDDG
jgi:murein DD-endopeptidase MepM/ murein hydrolase activator NlpD